MERESSNVKQEITSRSNQDLTSNTILLAEAGPIADMFVLGTKKCAYCSETNAKSKCSRCKTTYYCGRKCQANHWKQGHKKECQPLEQQESHLVQATQGQTQKVSSLGSNKRLKQSSHQDEDEFSDDEDRSAFCTIPYGAELYDETLRWIKQNDPQTKSLRILDDKDEFTEDSYRRIGFYLKDNTHATNLCLSQSNINCIKFGALLEGGLKHNTVLTSLLLEGNQQLLNYGGSKLLAKYLNINKNIDDLDLSDTDLTPDELLDIIPALDGSKIETLTINGNMLHNDMKHLPNTPQSWNQVLKLFEKISLPNLTYLDAEDCQAGGSLCEAIVHLIRKKDSKLKHVDLSSNFLCGMDIEEILKDGAKGNTTLKSLNLSYNEDMEGWVKEWQEELSKSNSSLKVIHELC